jgi:hypothetical protein
MRRFDPWCISAGEIASEVCLISKEIVILARGGHELGKPALFIENTERKRMRSGDRPGFKSVRVLKLCAVDSVRPFMEALWRSKVRPCRPAGFDVVDRVGVLLIVLGMLALASPLMAAVAVNVIISWLIVVACVVHLIIAFHSHRAGSVSWRLLVGLAYVFFGVYLLAHPAVGVASLTLVLATLFLVEGILNIALYFQVRAMQGAGWFLLDGIVTPAFGSDDLPAMALEFRLGNRDASRCQPDRERRDARDAMAVRNVTDQVFPRSA